MSDGVIMAAATTATSSSHLQNLLQRAVQTVQWTYIIYWRLCSLQRLLVWGDGYYNGGIKTRKTVHLKEVSTEEASLQRSQQLRELYEMLLRAAATEGGENHQTYKKTSATALSPEDLTESEWFYLMCFSYSFPPDTGLPGTTYTKRQHVWLTGANEVESHTFSRVILAKSAQIRTVVCIPLLDGVVEVGTTQRVEEDLGFIQHMTNFLINLSHKEEPRFMHPPTKPALSEHSTSNQPPPISGYTTSPAAYITTMSSHHEDVDKEEVEVVGAGGDSDDHVMINNNPNNSIPQSQTQSSDLMQLDIISSEFIRSPDHEEYSKLHICHAPLSSSGGVSSVNEELPMQEPVDDTHYYSQTLATILQPQSNRPYRFSDISKSHIHHHPSRNSAFFKWSSSNGISSTSNYLGAAASQRKLKYILFITPPFLLHNSIEISHDQKQYSSTTTSFYPANHALSERRRREKLNERFVILKSLLPIAAKVDKATILGDAIEYVKQLRNKIQELEEAAHQGQLVKENIISTIHQVNEPKDSGHGESSSSSMININNKKKMTTEKGKGKLKATDQQPEVHVEVSIIEKDALVEMQCPYMEGLLLDVMQMLRQLRLEITAVQSSLSNGLFVAELRAKVKENVKGRKATIMEVKKAIHQTVACGINGK